MTKHIVAKVMTGVLSVALTAAGAVGHNTSTANLAADYEHAESVVAEEGSVNVYYDNWAESCLLYTSPSPRDM